MKKTIRAKGITQTQDLQGFIDERIDAALSKYRQALSGVSIWLEDMNGPKGGVDKRCRVKVSGPNLREIVAESRDTNLLAALHRAMEIAGRAVSRSLRRSQRLALVSSRSLAREL